MVDLSIVKNFYEKLNNNFPESYVYYSVKANPALEIINCLKNNGANVSFHTV